ncbi:hypothetical protein [Pseudoalteromonas sp. L1]|uniref:hypothetical protein n=1 Tax=unclassified Pseudoalteromonas TaxID=194690 RepID=UPI001F2DE2F7|nr:hypothetical protein [Pseudoalteromonas sp. L1]
MIKHSSLVVSAVLMTACSALPIKKDIDEGKFRVENFQYEHGKQRDYVYLMCNSKSVSAWEQARQYEAGEHVLWVKAVISERDFPSSEKNAFARFDMNFKEGGNYTLNREVKGDKISIWFADKETGNQASEVITKELKRPLVIEDQLRKKQCLEGTV